MVLQEAGARLLALPEKSDTNLRDKLKIQLATMHEMQGEMTLEQSTRKAHVNWYENDRKTRLVEHELLETYYVRRPQHLLRIAMCLHLSTCHDMVVCETCWNRALAILNWTERFLPMLASKMFKSAWGEEQDLVLKKIRSSNNGQINHSDLIRRMQYRMGAAGTKNILASLKEAGIVREIRNTVEHYYILTTEGHDD
jgi:hypothetical protein